MPAGERAVLLVIGGRTGPECEGTARVLKLAEGLKDRGFSIQVVTMASHSERDLSEGVRSMPGLRRAWSRPIAVRRLSLTMPPPARPSLIHGVGIETAAAALALADELGVPYVLSVSEFPDPATIVRLSRTLCRKIIAPSLAIADDLRRGFGIPDEKLGVIRPGIEVVGSERRPPSAAAARTAVAGASAQTVRGHGEAALFSAARILSDSGLDLEIVVARGGWETRRHARRCGLSHTLTIADDDRQDAPFWAAIDVYCQASHANSFGWSTLRAMASRTPVIATDQPGARELITDGVTGRIVPPRQPEILAAAIRAAIVNRGWADMLARRALGDIRGRFDPRRELDETAALYREALEPAAPFARAKRPSYSFAHDKKS